MAKNSRRNPKRRSKTHRSGSNPLRVFASRPFVEDLEARRLLAVVINEFGGSGTITNPAGITRGPDGNLWYTEANPAAGGIGRITPSGAIEQFTNGLTSGSSPTGIAAGSDGALWFTESDSDKIGRITTSGTITEFNVPTANSFPDQITAGPDDALWFTEHDGNKIGRITTAGSFTEYAIPSANAQPLGITVGPDGALWFVENGANKIGRIDTGGAITEYSTGITPNSGPTGITTGPDGALWFTEHNVDKIGRVTPSGVITEFSSGMVSGGPAGITAGPDGNLWYTEQDNGQIGRITTAGVVTEFTDPGIRPVDGLLGITDGPDGNLWFTALNGDHVDKITTGGAITQFPSTSNVLTSGAGPVGIAAGPDNALWFTEFNAGQIGRIDPSGQITEFSQGILSGANPNEITLGPVPTTGGQANLWFTESNQNVIGEITPRGAVSQFTSSGSLPEGITLGSDGNLWFAQLPGAIGRITPQGATQFFTNGLTSGFMPRFITSGPDGALWFTANSPSGGEIGRITPPSVTNPNPIIAEFPVPSNTLGGTVSNVSGIAVGSDNNLWFTDAGNVAIGRITPTATPVITEFSQGLGPQDDPFRITGGPDGNLWVTETNANKIDRVTPQGVITQFSIPTSGSFPQAITLGPDDNLWFTETNANQIGQVVLTQSITNPTGTPASAVATLPSSFEVATFADNSTATNAANFSATIDYGDGTTGPGTILPVNSRPGTYMVLGSHAYATTGTFTARVTIGNDTGTLAPVQATITASSPIDLTASPFDGTTGRRSNTLVATFTDQDSTATSFDFTATVDWGDNTSTSAVTIIPMSSGTSTYFAIYAGHSYVTSGTFATSVKIVDTRNNLTEQGSASASIADAAMNTIFNEFGPSSLTPGAGPTAITRGPDGALWFAETNIGNIGRVDTSGNVTEFVPILPSFTGPTVVNPGPAGITTGSDSNLWYTDPGNSRIVQLTPGGLFNFFSFGLTSGSDPFGITSGPDLNLWFTEAGADQIGRITTSGVITEFSRGIASGLSPESITTGSDGNLWFVGPGSNLIGRITRTGTITEFPGATGSGLTSITSGPDGDLWFTEQDSNLIGKIDPVTFKVTEFSDPAISGPTDITTGPDGNLWFTESFQDAIGRITPAGVVDSFSTGLTLMGHPTGIVAGPDGNLYFTQLVGDRIGQVILPRTSAIASAPAQPPQPAFDTPYTGVFANFTDNSPAANLTNFLATIDYGDGNSGTGTIVPLMRNGVVVPGSFQVMGTNTYATFGPFNYTVTIYNDANATAFNGSLTVQPPVAFSVTGIDVSTQADRSFTEPVAFFTDSVGPLPPSSYILTIRWGDGTSSSGTLGTYTNGDLDVIGTHTYSTTGQFTITTTVRLASIPADSGSGTSTAHVTPFVSVLSATGVNVFATRGNAFNGPVADFSDTSQSNGGPATPTYTATINWGDGTPTTQGIIQQSSTVIGNHVYTKLGTFQVTVMISLVGAPDTAISTSLALVEVAGPIDEVKDGITGDPSSIAAGSDGNLWFTQSGSGQIGRITTGGAVTEFPTGLASGITPRSIADGPDGNLWFTQDGAAAIGRITLQGVVTDFIRGFMPNSTPDMITSGPDGNLWFTDDSGAIGRITPQGVVTEFTAGLASGTVPGSITTGPDGDLWFTEMGVDLNPSYIGRITTRGAITNFPLPAGREVASDGFNTITAGPDGALWFTEGSGAIGRITTSGLVTDFNDGLSADSQLNGITAGPDGNLWFVDSGTNHVDRITTAGVISTFAIPTSNSVPLGIVTGSDDNLWFTENNAGQIGQVVLPNSVIPIGATLNATAGQPLTAAYASFRDKSSLVDLTRFFTPTINFGDGTIGSGTLTSDGQGGFVAIDTHTYATAGTFSGSSVITNVIGTSAPSTLTVNVAAASRPSFVVVNTNDSGPGSLRQAILNADLFPGHTITFAIPADGVATISVLAALPDINGLTTIDGRSQAVFEGSASTQPLVEVDGRAVGGSSPGLLFDGGSGGSTVDGLAIYGFAGPQIELASPGDYVFDSYIGLRANGSIPAPLSGGPTVSASATVAGAGDGVLVLAANAIIGTFLPGQGNVISGNAGQGIEISGPQTTSVGVFGNLIGLDPTGQAARGNALNGILVTGGAGFEFIGPRNVISGNANDGISLLGSRSVWISGNFIGTNLTANRAIGNGVDGVSLDLGSMDVTIGGLTPGATNIISGNGSTGIALRAGSDHNFIQADLIGTNLPGDAAIGNGIAGVLISDSSSNVIGPRDLISGNGTASQGAGVWIDGAAATNNLVIGDRIGTDLAGEAAIPNSVIGVLINDGSANSVGDGSFGDGNQVSGNSLIGVMIAGTSASANLIAGNLIGTDATGTKPLANGSTHNGAGVYIDGSPGNFVGGTTASLGNVISGNGFDGVQIFGATAAGNLFQGNRIGTDISGALPLGNGDDGLVVNDAPGTRIVGNIIAANLVNGILLTGAGASGTLIQGNAIGRGIGGQALGNGGFGVLIINGAPLPTLVANVNANNALGPIRDTNATPAGTTATAKSSKKVKVVHKKSAKVKPMASRPLEAFHAKSHPKKK